MRVPARSTKIEELVTALEKFQKKKILLLHTAEEVQRIENKWKS